MLEPGFWHNRSWGRHGESLCWARLKVLSSAWWQGIPGRQHGKPGQEDFQLPRTDIVQIRNSQSLFFAVAFCPSRDRANNAILYHKRQEIQPYRLFPRGFAIDASFLRRTFDEHSSARRLCCSLVRKKKRLYRWNNVCSSAVLLHCFVCTIPVAHNAGGRAVETEYV